MEIIFYKFFSRRARKIGLEEHWGVKNMSMGKQRRTKVLSGVIAVTSVVAVAVWQFYLFVTFRNETGVVDVQGGTFHLWLAIGLGLIACIVAFLFFSVFLRYDSSDEMHITS